MGTTSKKESKGNGAGATKDKHQSKSRTKRDESRKCEAFSADSEFVSEGMVPCLKNCSKVVYCSTDCREWHWRSGGHRSICAGTDQQKAGGMSNMKDISMV